MDDRERFDLTNHAFPFGAMAVVIIVLVVGAVFAAATAVVAGPAEVRYSNVDAGERR